MDDDAKATVPEQVLDANQAEPPKVEEQAVSAPTVEDPAPEPEVETPVPEMYHLKIKVQGEEKEVTLTRDELITKIQLAEDYHKKCAQLGEDKRKILPYVHVLQTQEFQELCEDLSRDEPVTVVPEPELLRRVRKGDAAAAAKLILQRGKERV